MVSQGLISRRYFDTYAILSSGAMEDNEIAFAKDRKLSYFYDGSTYTAVGNSDYYFADDTTVSPVTSGNPLVSEIQVVATANDLYSTFIYYNGTDIASTAASATYTWYTDIEGVVINIPTFENVKSYVDNISITNITAGGYVILPTDRLIQVDSITALGDSITLPSGVSIGKMFTIKDASGTANTNPITLITAGSELIDGSSSVILSINYISYTLYFDGVNYFTI